MPYWTMRNLLLQISTSDFIPYLKRLKDIKNFHFQLFKFFYDISYNKRNIKQ